MRQWILAAMIFCGVPSLACADPTGEFLAKGQNEDGSSYEGTVKVSRTGDTYRVVWTIADSETTGTAVGGSFRNGAFMPGKASFEDNALSVVYKSGDITGVAVYSEQPDGSWKGVWTYDGAQVVLSETWINPSAQSGRAVGAGSNGRLPKPSLPNPKP